MIPQQTTWGMIEPTMYVQAKDGVAYRVVAKRYHSAGLPPWQFRLIDAAGNTYDQWADADAIATLLLPTDEEAERMVEALLGGQTLHRKFVRMEEIRTAPDSQWARAAMAAHLLNMHHVSITTTAHKQNESMDELVELHALEHANPGSSWVPHVHVASGDL